MSVKWAWFVCLYIFRKLEYLPTRNSKFICDFYLKCLFFGYVDSGQLGFLSRPKCMTHQKFIQHFDRNPKIKFKDFYLNTFVPFKGIKIKSRIFLMTNTSRHPKKFMILIKHRKHPNFRGNKLKSSVCVTQYVFENSRNMPIITKNCTILPSVFI